MIQVGRLVKGFSPLNAGSPPFKVNPQVSLGETNPAHFPRELHRCGWIFDVEGMNRKGLLEDDVIGEVFEKQL